MRYRLSSLALVASILVTAPLLAQPPAETCGPGDSLSSSDTLPFNGTAVPASDDFTMTGTSCTEQGLDHVTCLVPENTCTVEATCFDAPGISQVPEGLQVAVNVFDGGCTTSPASCIASDVGTGSGTVTGVTLTAGTAYCFVCEVFIPQLPIQLQITATSGDCGGLPVELQGLTVE